MSPVVGDHQFFKLVSIVIHLLLVPPNNYPTADRDNDYALSSGMKSSATDSLKPVGKNNKKNMKKTRF